MPADPLFAHNRPMLEHERARVENLASHSAAGMYVPSFRLGTFATKPAEAERQRRWYIAVIAWAPRHENKSHTSVICSKSTAIRRGGGRGRWLSQPGFCGTLRSNANTQRCACCCPSQQPASVSTPRRPISTFSDQSQTGSLETHASVAQTVDMRTKSHACTQTDDVVTK